MFEYHAVMSIHDQKMRQYRAEAKRARAARLARQGRLSVGDRLAQALVRRLREAGEALLAHQQRADRLA